MKSIFLSIVIPCLNEEKSIAECIKKAKIGLLKLYKQKLYGEILVVDNNSTDASAAIARRLRVKVVSEHKRGYGAAYKKGFQKARGKYIIMGDADGTYDFSAIEKFVQELQSGADLVLGSRFIGVISPHAMPFFNRYIGNPVLTSCINICYQCHISDSQTGFRAISKKAIKKMHLTSDGMEFASEMIIKSISKQLVIKEIPIQYAPRIGISKLSPMTDAWRHIQAILIYSPTYAIILPGIILFLIGSLGTTILLPGPIHLNQFIIDIHTMTMMIFLASIGASIILTGVIARIYTVKRLYLEGGWLTKLLLQHVTLGKIMGIGLFFTALSLIIISTITLNWVSNGFHLFAAERIFLVALGFGFIGLQCIFSSFLIGLFERS